MDDFAIALKALVEDGAQTSYLAVVKRTVDGKDKVSISVAHASTPCHIKKNPRS